MEINFIQLIYYPKFLSQPLDFKTELSIYPIISLLIRIHLHCNFVLINLLVTQKLAIVGGHHIKKKFLLLLFSARLMTFLVDRAHICINRELCRIKCTNIVHIVLYLNNNFFFCITALLEFFCTHSVSLSCAKIEKFHKAFLRNFVTYTE